MSKDKYEIQHWDPEDRDFWESTGKRIAYRNLWISIPCLLLSFGFWQMWGILAVQMGNLGFPFTEGELFTLVAISGLAGATLRIPATFMVRIAGGRHTISCSTVLMVIPCLGAYFALQNPDTPLWVFQFLALLSGVGGGNFASSMANISPFFPRSQQGLALGLNAGLGNLGVTGMQILVPLLMTTAVFGVLSGAPMELQRASGTLFGSIPAGTSTWLQNPPLFGAVTLGVFSVMAWFGMNNLRTVSPSPGGVLAGWAKVIVLYNVGFLASIIGLYLFLPRPIGLGLFNMWITLPLTIFITLGLLRLIPGEIQTSIKSQYAIFKDRHTWSMSLLYIATFGSFIGFAAALPLSIEVIFGYRLVDGVRIANPNAPSALTWAWIGPLIGALARPVGGWISDRVGGSIVTQAISAVMVVASAAVGYVMMLAYSSETPTDYFWPFLILFIVIFAASGIGNGSTFRTVGVLFDQQSKGPVLGWTSAIAAYGSFIAPRVMGDQIEAGQPELAMYGFAIFYVVCLLVNWWFYLRPNAYVKNP